MSNHTVTGYTIVDASESFHLIDPETGLTITSRCVRDTATQNNVKVTEVAEKELRAETPASTVSRSAWSMLATTQVDEMGGTVLAASAAEQSPSFSESRGLESASPSHAEQLAAESINNVECFSSVLSRPSQVNQHHNHHNDAGDEEEEKEEKEEDEKNNDNVPQRPVPHYAVEIMPASVNNSNTATPTLASSKEKESAMNAVLRAQLAEADRKNVYYMRLYEQSRDELNNLHQTMSLLLHGDNENEFGERLGGDNADLGQGREGWHGQRTEQQNFLNRPSWLQQLLRVVGFETAYPTPICCRQDWRGGWRPSSYPVAVDGENYMTSGWKRDFSYAKWHARHGRAALAMESLLLAISSDEFDAWRSLLVEEPHWNRLRGIDRQRWYCLVAVKLSELLDKRNSRRRIFPAKSPNEQRGASCPAEEVLNEEEDNDGREARQEVPTDRRNSLTVDLLAPFLRRMSWYYAGEKQSNNERVAAAERTGTLSGEMIPTSHEAIGAALEDLLLASIATFPHSAVLFYLLASMRAIQGRQEESLHFLGEVIRLDPSHLLREGCSPR
ncbi:hypothetical protein MOQ_005219 [Trypanosoma cruzi marinkellei]|uniref:Uncharacterized protein n=1 Tax=Trypanosoma cruzi marinkellei TaxID=85056 RepID=K2N855_TRYCR|nr:hypothetical protein MOQ_005219 [Trypanosoma cruzi marinkellei]